MSSSEGSLFTLPKFLLYRNLVIYDGYPLFSWFWTSNVSSLCWGWHGVGHVVCDRYKSTSDFLYTGPWTRPKLSSCCRTITLGSFTILRHPDSFWLPPLSPVPEVPGTCDRFHGMGESRVSGEFRGSEICAGPLTKSPRRTGHRTGSSGVGDLRPGPLVNSDRCRRRRLTGNPDLFVSDTDNIWGRDGYT